jgi:sirohydrochlorin ferrochelatase
MGATGSDADPRPAVGTIVVAHGAGPEWNAQVQEVARRAQTGGPVEVSFLMGPGAKAHRFQDAAKRLAEAGVREIVVVPLLISSHSGHYEQIRWLVGETDTLDGTMRHHLHMAGIERPDVDVPMRVTPAIDGAPELAGVLAEHALALAEEPAAQALFLIGHGPNSAEDYAAWMEDLRPLAERVQQTTGFRDVKVGLVQDDAAGPVRAEAVRRIREIITLQHQVTGRPVVVVPVLIGTGQISLEKFPADLAGLPIAYDGKGLVPHPALARWIEARVGAGW